MEEEGQVAGEGPVEGEGQERGGIAREVLCLL